MKKDVFLIGLVLVIFLLIINNIFAQTKNSDQKHASCIFRDSVSIKNAKMELVERSGQLYEINYWITGWMINKSSCSVKDISMTVNFHTILDTTLSVTVDSFVLLLPPRIAKFISLPIAYQIQIDMVESFSVYVSKANIEVNGKDYTFKRSE